MPGSDPYAGRDQYQIQVSELELDPKSCRAKCRKCCEPSAARVAFGFGIAGLSLIVIAAVCLPALNGLVNNIVASVRTSQKGVRRELFGFGCLVVAPSLFSLRMPCIRLNTLYPSPSATSSRLFRYSRDQLFFFFCSPLCVASRFVARGLAIH